MASEIPNGDIVGAAIALVEVCGFAGARIRADELIAEWAASAGADADDGLHAWAQIRATIDTLEANKT